MRTSAPRGVIFALALLAGLGCGDARAEREGRRGILRDLIGGLAPDSPERKEAQARSTEDLAVALRLYGDLAENQIDRPEGVRAALVLGSYYYTVGHGDEALRFFERARDHASDPDLRSRAGFWCEQARLAVGAEPLAQTEGAEGEGFYGVLRRLCRVDRSILQGRRSDAEEVLLALETSARQNDCAGLALARWGRMAQVAGSSRAAPRDLLPLARQAAALPERAFFDFSLVGEGTSSEAARRWSLQFGAFLERSNAELQEQELSLQGIPARIDISTEKEKVWYRVRYGDYAKRAEADSAARAIRNRLSVPLQIVQTP